MGKVYQARDTKLDRDVALKVLPEAFTSDPERLARFEREAKVLASLNHPNIGAIHGLEESGGVKALVLELIEGPTLADRIARGPIPIDEALPIAKQIAEALEAAHEAGVIHRDLKPANIKVREDGTVKVLDFGLAKAFQPAASDPNLSLSPTVSLTAAATQMGMVIGTAAYMAPEQAKGKVVDKRADVWAFGAVVYEMLTGKRAFAGEDVSDTLAAVLRAEVDWSRVPSTLSPGLRVFLVQCLQRDPRQRIPDIAAMRLALDGVFETVRGRASAAVSVPGSAHRAQRVLPWAAGVALAGLAAVAAWNLKPAEPRLMVRSVNTLPEGQRFDAGNRHSLAIAPDGRHFVYGVSGGLYLRALNTLETTSLVSTQRVPLSPVFSPDGQSVAYHEGGQLMRVSITGGSPVALASVSTPSGMSWERDGTILYGQSDGVWVVSDDGGEPERLVALEEDAETLVHSPQRLPGGDWILFSRAHLSTGSLSSAASEILVASAVSGEQRVVRVGGADPRYLATGHLVYADEGVLYAVPFDVDRLEVTGGPVPVVEGVRQGIRIQGAAQFDISAAGHLVFVPGAAGGFNPDFTLAVADRTGAMTRLDVPPGPFVHVRASPDGTHLALDSDDGDEAVVWIYELGGASAVRRLTFGGRNQFPVWSPDGQRVAFQSDRDGDHAIFLQRADGVGEVERLTTPADGEDHIPESWSPDGRHLSFSVLGSLSFSLWIASLDDGTATPFSDVESGGPIGSVFSPDGRWLAYRTNGVYVEPFPATGARYQAPRVDRDFHPVWSPDGAELFYIGSIRSGQLVATRTSMPSGVTFGGPELTPFLLTAGRIAITPRAFDVLPDGRFVGLVGDTLIDDTASVVSEEIRLVFNWFEELKARVPTN